MTLLEDINRQLAVKLEDLSYTHHERFFVICDNYMADTDAFLEFAKNYQMNSHAFIKLNPSIKVVIHVGGSTMWFEVATRPEDEWFDEQYMRLIVPPFPTVMGVSTDKFLLNTLTGERK